MALRPGAFPLEVKVGIYPIDENRRSPEIGRDKAMEAATNICKIAFLGDYLPRKCGIATFPSAAGEYSCMHKPGLGQGGEAKGRAGD